MGGVALYEDMIRSMNVIKRGKSDGSKWVPSHESPTWKACTCGPTKGPSLERSVSKAMHKWGCQGRKLGKAKPWQQIFKF